MMKLKLLLALLWVITDDHDDENNNDVFTVFYEIDAMGNIFAKYFAICGMIK